MSQRLLRGQHLGVGKQVPTRGPGGVPEGPGQVSQRVPGEGLEVSWRGPGGSVVEGCWRVPEGPGQVSSEALGVFGGVLEKPWRGPVEFLEGLWIGPGGQFPATAGGHAPSLAQARSQGPPQGLTLLLYPNAGLTRP